MILERSDGQVYGARYWTVHPVLEPDWVDPQKHQTWANMMAWIIETFGPCHGSIWGDKPTPNPGERWYANNAKFWFREEADLLLFLLRWQ